MLTNIPIDGFPRGITLYTSTSPSLEQLHEAVARFHEFPLLADSPFVVLGDPSDFCPEDRVAMHRIGIPGYENLGETETDPVDDQQ